MKINPLFLFLMTTLTTLVACRNGNAQIDDDKEMLFVEHYVRYDAQDKHIKAIATFKQGTDVLNAKPTAIKEGVVLNGTPLKETKSNLGTNYEIEGPKTTFDAAYRFSFKNPLTQGIYETEFMMPAVENITLPEKQLSKKNGGKIVWQGKPLANGEELSLRFEDAQGNNLEVTVVGNGGHASEYTFRSGQLNEIAVGKVTMYPIRTQTTAIGKENTLVKGKLVTEFYAQPIEIMVAE